jgi:ParB-like chromosome segregation protein Spo0J
MDLHTVSNSASPTRLRNMNYQQHSLSAAFPSMTDEEYQSLKDSIDVNGVLNPITIYEGMVLDGWHRYQAAMELGMDCPEAELEDWIDPKDFVLAQNKNRRHITMSQLAMATAAVYEWISVGRPNNSAMMAPLNKTNDELAEISGTSKRTIARAKAVMKDATPEVQDAVKSGKIGLYKAQEISKLPKDKQAAAIDKPIIAPERPRLTEDYGPSEAELKANELAHQADLELLNKMLEADDALATAYTENKRLNYLNAELQVRINILTTQKSEAIKQAQKYQRQVDRLNGSRI